MALLKFGFTAEQVNDEGYTTEEDIRVLKTWLADQCLPKLTDEQIVLFLLSCCNELDSTKATIKAYYFLTSSFPDIANDRRVERKDLQKQLKAIDYCVLPERTDNGCAVVLVRLHDTYYRNFDMGPAMTLFSMTVDAVQYDNPPKGLIILFDMSGVGLLHLRRINRRLVKGCIQYMQEGLPIRLEQIHILNTVYFIDKLIFLLKPFISAKIFEMVHFHQKNINMDVFYENWLPKRCLPKDYGGHLPSVEVLHQKTVEKLTQMQPYFDAEEAQRSSIS